MRLSDLVWAVAASVGVSCILVAGKTRELLDDRQLNYDSLRSLDRSDHHRNHHIHHTSHHPHQRELTLPPRTHDESSPLQNVIETQDPLGSYKLNSRRKTSKRKYSKLEKKTHRRKERKNRRLLHRGHKHKSRSEVKPSLSPVAKHISVGEKDHISYTNSRLFGRYGEPNEIVISSYQRPRQYKHHRTGFHESSTTATPSKSPSVFTSRRDDPTTPPSTTLSKDLPTESTISLHRSPIHENSLPDTKLGLKADTLKQSSLVTEPSVTPTDTSSKKTTSSKKYPYSTTFQSFDSFLNSIGTSFKIADETHAIRPRSGDGKPRFEQADEPHDPGSVDLEDPYRANALDDPLEQDRMTLLNMPERCCGSKVPIDHNNSKVTGAFERVAAGGSIKVVEVPEEDSDPLPPSIVRDFKVSVTGPRSITLTWSAPGDDLDHGIVSRYIMRMSDTRYDLRERRFDQASSYTDLEINDLLEAAGVFQEAGSKVKVTVNVDEAIPVPLKGGQQYYLAFRSQDEANNTSPVSNVATFTLPEGPENISTTTTTTSTTTERPTTTTTTTSPTSSTTTTTTPRPTTTLRPTTTTEPNTIDVRTAPTEAPPYNQPLGRNVITATMRGRVISYPQPEPEPKPRKEPKRKARGRKNKERKAKRRRSKKQGRQEQQVSSPISSFDSGYQYPPACLTENGETISDGKLCSAISGLLTVIDYMEETREFTHLDYLYSVLTTLKHRAQPHWKDIIV